MPSSTLFTVDDVLIAARSGDFTAVDEQMNDSKAAPADLLNARDVLGETLVHQAARHGCNAVLIRLLDLGADPSVERAPAYGKFTPLYLATLERHASTVQVLLDRGARQDPGNQGCEALAGAVAQGDIDVAQRLWKAGGDLARCPSTDASLLHLAVRRNDPVMLHWLLLVNAPQNEVSLDGLSWREQAHAIGANRIIESLYRPLVDEAHDLKRWAQDNVHPVVTTALSPARHRSTFG